MRRDIERWKEQKKILSRSVIATLPESFARLHAPSQCCSDFLVTMLVSAKSPMPSKQDSLLETVDSDDS